jgi:hypothetical protein
MSKNRNKASKEAHASASQKGMGDYYGTGVRAKVGRMRDGAGTYGVSRRGLKTPPKSVV